MFKSIKNNKREFITFVTEVLFGTFIATVLIVSCYGLTDKFPMFDIFKF